jgi:hypothetical protein
MTATAYPTPEEIWTQYTGGETPREFIVRLSASSADAAVDAFLDSLPDVYGIVRLQNWKQSFENPWQLRRNQVREGLLTHLERHHESWWDALRDEDDTPASLPPAPAPSEADVSAVEAATEDAPVVSEEVAEQAPLPQAEELTPAHAEELIPGANLEI